MATKQSVLAAARRRYGKNVELRIGRTASSAETRNATRKRLRTLKDRVEEIDNLIQRQQSLKITRALIAAARFVVDVDGDKTAIADLALAVQAAEAHDALIREKHEAMEEQESLRGSGLDHYYRYELIVREGQNGMVWSRIEAYADTLKEIADQLDQKAPIC